MKIQLLVLIFFFSISNLYGQAVTTKLNRSLIRELHHMEKDDQKSRDYYIKLSTGKHQNDSLLIQNANIKIHKIDSLNYDRVRYIFLTYGYPNYDLVGTTGEFYFWLLVQHQDQHLEFQDSVLTAMKVQVDSNKATAVLYAYLLDRVKVNSGQLQIYGTQTRLNFDSSSYEPIPVIDPEHLNERRQSIGLGPIEKYIESINKTYMRKPQD